MDPLTIALATFGVQKIRGKSTRTALKDAATMAGLGQFAGMAGVPGLQAFGSTSLPGYAGNTGAQAFGGIRSMFAPSQTMYKGVPFNTEVGLNQLDTGSTAGNFFRDKIIGTKGNQTALEAAIKQGMDPELAAQKFGGSGFMGLDTGTKLGIGLAATTALSGDEDDVKPPFTDEDYEKAYEKQKAALGDLGQRYDYGNDATGSNNIYDFDENYYAFNKGGIVNALPKFNVGGINYLPSKTDHDEQDVNNYVRATGYVEDGSGNGDKDEDTMLAQLADGEFVSRADAILGAGIMEGANPSSMKDMRKKGAAFFYDQQAKLKRIFDLLNAARKEKN